MPQYFVDSLIDRIAGFDADFRCHFRSLPRYATTQARRKHHDFSSHLRAHAAHYDMMPGCFLAMTTAVRRLLLGGLTAETALDFADGGFRI